jgi:hypothetical protein
MQLVDLDYSSEEAKGRKLRDSESTLSQAVITKLYGSLLKFEVMATQTKS